MIFKVVDLINFRFTTFFLFKIYVSLTKEMELMCKTHYYINYDVNHRLIFIQFTDKPIKKNVRNKR